MQLVVLESKHLWGKHTWCSCLVLWTSFESRRRTPPGPPARFGVGLASWACVWHGTSGPGEPRTLRTTGDPQNCWGRRGKVTLCLIVHFLIVHVNRNREKAGHDARSPEKAGVSGGTAFSSMATTWGSRDGENFVGFHADPCRTGGARVR